MQDARKTIRNTRPDQQRSEGAFGILLALTVVLCVAATMLVARGEETASAADSLSAQVQVQLRATAVVDQAQILLADIADIEGPGSDLAARWTVLSAPDPGESRVVSLEQLQRILADRGANLAKWEIRGYRECRVSRPSLPPAHAAEAAGTKQPPSTSQPAFDDTLEGTIRAYLSEKTARVEGAVNVQFSSAIRHLLAMRPPQYQFRIQHRGDRVLGMVALEVTILEGDRVRQTVPMVVQVTLRKQVVVAAQAINRNQVISPQHLSLVERSFDRLDETGLTDTAPLTGQRAKRFIQAGELVQFKDVEPMPFVQRNDLVTVTIRRGSVSIRTVAKALGSGTYGDAVRLQNESSREAFEAVITGLRTAEVGPATATRPAGPTNPTDPSWIHDARLSARPTDESCEAVEYPALAKGGTRP